MISFSSVVLLCLSFLIVLRTSFCVFWPPGTHLRRQWHLEAQKDEQKQLGSNDFGGYFVVPLRAWRHSNLHSFFNFVDGTFGRHFADFVCKGLPKKCPGRPL